MCVPIEKLQNGDILICSSNGILGRMIKLATRSTVNHVAMVIDVSGVKMVIDSQSNGTNVKTFENWKKEYGYKYVAYRYKQATPEWGKKIRAKALSKTGVTGYDFASLIIYQPLYLITGKWIGLKEEKAGNRMYCSEFVAWVFDFPRWWTYSPKDVENFLSDNEYYEKIS